MKSRVSAIGLIGTMAAMSSAQAAETRSFVVDWFYMTPAVSKTEVDCVGGLNPPADIQFARMLRDLGKSEEDIEEALAGFPHTMYQVRNRGRINGKEVNVYTNPTSTHDPNIKRVSGPNALGFNLDGEVSENDFFDPETGEKGIDNQFFRALGCINSERGDLGTRPTYPTIQWDTARPQMQAWLIQVRGIDDARNDDDVEVGVYQANMPIVRDLLADAQWDVTFQLNGNPRSKNEVKGRIENGVVMTDAFDLNLIGHRYFLPELTMHKAKLRLKLNEDGSATGVVGGYQKWPPLYANLAKGGSSYEVNLSFDVPGMYYALKKSADADPDPETGQNLSISAAYRIEAVPAYIVDGNAQTARAE